MAKSMRYLAALAAVVLFTGCLRHGEAPGSETDNSNSEYFDFATTKRYTLTVDYSLPGYTAGILFEVYAENPYRSYQQNSQTPMVYLLKEGLEPIFKAATDKNGHFSGAMKIPAGIKTVWIYTDYFGVPSSVEVPITDTAIRVDLTGATARSVSHSAGSRSGNHTYPEGVYAMDGLDDWDALGVPSYINPAGARKTLPTGLLSDLYATLPEANSLFERPEQAYLIAPDCNHNIKIVKDAEVEMVFLHDGAVMTNVVGYYTYPTATPPATPADIDRKTIAFPNASLANTSMGEGGLFPGDYVKLKYWDGEKYVDKFPAGVTIGFFIHCNAFDDSKGWNHNGTGNIHPISRLGSAMYFSAAYLNYQDWPETPADKRQQTVSLYDYRSSGDRNLVVIGFEDQNRGGQYASSDHDFNDVVFYITADPADGIDVPDERKDDLNPNPDPEPQPYSIDYKGTLAFEDLWPNKGDYDMNDVGVEYHCTVWRDKDNKVFKVVDRFVPVHKGAEFANGFGYQYGVPVSVVKGAIDWTVVPDKPRPWYALNEKGLEYNQALATVMLFEDIRAEVEGPDFDFVGDQQSPKYEYTITTEFSPAQRIEDVGFPPYNPFIVVIHKSQNETSYVDPRNREVHLPNYPPTDLARDKDGGLWFGHYADKSNKTSLWYVSSENYPFAINIPITGFRFAPERVPIDQIYPKFGTWARSHGDREADWYK